MTILFKYSVLIFLAFNNYKHFLYYNILFSVTLAYILFCLCPRNLFFQLKKK